MEYCNKYAGSPTDQRRHLGKQAQLQHPDSHRRFVFGTSIVADVELSPIRKGIKLGKIEMRLIEAVTKRINFLSEGATSEVMQGQMNQMLKAEMEFPGRVACHFGEDSVDNPIMEDEKYVFKAISWNASLSNSADKIMILTTSTLLTVSKLMVNIH